MGQARWSSVLQYLQQVAAPPGVGDLDDDQLLERFVTARDEAAFTALVRRHGPLVLGVCRRVLRHEADAEDAFQATFLVLARKAGSIARRESVGSWLYAVAGRIARKAATGAARQRRREQQLQDVPAPDLPHRELWHDVRAVLDEEIHRLPRLYRTPFVLCYLQGLTFTEAARQLGCPRGTVATRLARARERLRARLSRRGLTLSAGMLAALVSSNATAAVPAALVDATVKAGLLFAAGRAAVGGAVSLSATVLAKGVLRIMFITKLMTTLVVLLALGLGSATGVLTYRTFAADRAEDPVEVGSGGPRQKPQESPEDKLRRENEQLKKEIQDLKARIAKMEEAQAAVLDFLRAQLLSDQRDQGKVPAKPGIAPKQARLALQGHAGAVLAVAFSPDGKRIASGGADRVIKLWDAASGKEIDSLQGPSSRVNSLAFSPDGRFLVAGSADHVAPMWDATTGRLVRLFKVQGSVESVAFSPDGARLLTGGADQLGHREVVKLWDVASGKLLWRMEGGGNKIIRAAFSPDGKAILCGGSDGFIRLVDAATGKEIRRLAGRSDGIRALAFRADGRLVASGGADKTVNLWDMTTGRLLHNLKGHDGAVAAVAFSPDGRFLISGGLDKKVLIWDVATGAMLSSWEGNVGEITAMAVAPDGQTVAIGGTDKTVRLWRLGI